MKNLHTIFLNSEGKKHTLQPKVFDEAISAEQVRQGMASIAAVGIFESNDIQYYTEVSGAKIVETIETKLF